MGDKNCLSLMDFVITALVTDNFKVFPLFQNTDKALKITHLKKKKNSHAS